MKNPAFLMWLPFVGALAFAAPAPARSTPSRAPRAVNNPKKSGPPPEATPLARAMDDLKSTDVVRRRQGAEDIARLRDPHAIPALTVALSDTDEVVRASAARALGLMRTRDGVKELTRVLRQDPVPSVRQSAAVALGFIGDPASGEDLVKALKDDDAGTRYAAMQAVGVVKPPAAGSVLVEALGDPSAQYRRAAAQTLGQLGDASAAPALRGLLKDGDPGVQAAAVSSLGLLKDAASESAFKKNLSNKKAPAELRVASALALGRLGKKTGVDALVTTLADKSAGARVRLQAAQALGEIGDASLGPRIAGIADEETDEAVKPAVVALRDRWVEPR